MDEHRDQQPDPADGVAGDAAWTRLRAADPAAGAVPDAAALRAEVARRVADDAPVGATDDLPGAAAVVPLPARRPGRWLRVAAVAAGTALVAGAGGYAFGAAGRQDEQAAAAITLLGPVGASGAVGGAAGDAAATSEMRFAPGYGGRTVFSSEGLADAAGSGHAWALDAESVFSAETAARVARALGVPGEPSLQLGAWTVGPQDGSGPAVTLQPDGTASLSYYDPTRDPWSCTASAPDEPGAAEQPEASDDAGSDAAAPGGATLDPTLVEPALPSVTGPSCDPAAGAAPTGDAATAAVRDLLGSLGVDPDGFRYEVSETGDARASAVTASQVLDGQQTGLTWSVTLVAGGVQGLYGSLAPLVDLGEYPVVGAATAVERLNDPRFGSGYGGVMPLARAAEGAAADDALGADALGGDATTVAPEADPTVPPTADPGTAIPWPVQQVTITDARLGVSLVTGPDGAALLVPAYELTGTDGSTWSVVAVDESALALAG